MKYGYKGADRLLYLDRWLESLAHFLWSWNKLPGITGFGLILLAVVWVVISLWFGLSKTPSAIIAYSILGLSFLCGVEIDVRRRSTS